MSRQSPRSTVTVRIGGEEHVLRSTAEPAYAKKCATLLDKRIQEVKKLSGVSENHRAVILAALSITDEYFRAQEDHADLRKDVAARAMNLVRRIEDDLPGS